MLFRNKFIKQISWGFILTIFTSLLMLVSCVPTTMNTAGSKSNPHISYEEIVKMDEELSTTSELTTADTLIEKSRTFIDAHPKFHSVGKVYYILGTTLVKFDRVQEGITVLEELIKYYRIAPSVEPGLLALGFAYDKINQHDKANEYYDKLVSTSKYSSSKSAATARKLLQTDTSQRKGVFEDSSGGSVAANFIGQQAIDFAVEDLKGNPLSLEQFRGKVVLLDFWATWCPPCVAEIPNLKNTYAKYKNQGFQIVGISRDRSKSTLEKFIEEEGLAWPNYYDGSARVSGMYQVRSFPTTFLIDGEGIIRKANLRGSSLERAVAQLVKENMGR